MYRAEYGDTRVNRGKIKGQSRLRNFVAWQRKQYKKFLRGEKSQLTPERVLRLEDLGFEWTVNSRRDPDSYVGKDVILPDETYDNTGEANVSANENNAKDRVNEFASTRPKGEDIATAAAIAGLDTYGTMGRTTAEFENPPMKEEDAAENVAGFDAYGTKGGRTGDMGMNDGYSANMAQVPEIRAAAAMAVHPAGPLVGNAPQDGVGENINGNGGQAVRTDDLDITAPHDMPAQGGGETADSTLPTAHPGTYENYQYYQTSNYQY
uniref:Helicase-associated domain-containing protein n=1 Tax=Trieres chinensis TaxID=1514140 RepID=A0A7S1Z0W3_TRICV|mmetsp:Transcript_15021/g.30697  ORF Transcript_15021/g.30697 Transcript_15021/m.30697 type:complete len:265 (+) Transcript_15021:1-795(+)